MADNNFAFRRSTDPYMVPAGASASKFDVPDDLKSSGYMSFCVVNPNPFWVRLRGSTGTYVAVTDTTGWLFPPGFFGIFSTQYPEFMSAMGVVRQGLPVTAGGFLEVSYGGGA